MEHTVPESEYSIDYNKDFLDVLNDLERRNYDLRTNHNTAYFTFTGFIITIIAAFLGFHYGLGDCTKYMFLGSILSFVIGFYLYFEESAIGIRKMEKIANIVTKARDEKKDPKHHLEENLKKTCWENFIGKAYVYLQNLGLLLFIVGIIVYVAGG